MESLYKVIYKNCRKGKSTQEIKVLMFIDFTINRLWWFMFQNHSRKMIYPYFRLKFSSHLFFPFSFVSLGTHTSIFLCHVSTMATGRRSVAAMPTGPCLKILQMSAIFVEVCQCGWPGGGFLFFGACWVKTLGIKWETSLVRCAFDGLFFFYV